MPIRFSAVLLGVTERQGDNMIEVWKPVVGYEGLYEVSSLGRVMSCNLYAHKEPKIMKLSDNGTGYCVVGLSKNGKVKQFLVHRLVAEAFLEKIDGLDLINHKDENKKNNRIENLEWCDKSYNSTYSINRHPERKKMYGTFFKGSGYRGKPFKHTLKVRQYTKDNRLIAEFEDVVDANKKTGIKNCAIIACCKGKQHTAFGYVWKFAE